MRKFKDRGKNTIIRLVFCSLLIGLIGIVSCEKTVDSEPTGKCVYGPSGYKACVNGTFKSECEDNFKGTWYEGQKCGE